MRTQVGIIGAGPAGLFLGHLLRAQGIDAIILERRDREYALGRVRAGVLEQTTTDLMHRLGLGERLSREGLKHEGVNLAHDGEMFRIDLSQLSGGAAVTVYGQTEVVKDLMDAADTRGLQILFEAENVQLHDIAGKTPYITFEKNGVAQRLDCDFIAGCDGFHGVARAAIPSIAIETFERVYPFGWLGILAEVPPANDELIYSNHANGFALASMRSASRSRYYLQCGVHEKLEDWPDERFWDEVCLRLGPKVRVTRGPSFEKSIAPLRSFVAEPMRYGNLFLAGDAAHIVPPTGAKGLNLAISDVTMLSEALTAFYRTSSSILLDGYSSRALSRVWKAVRFSWWFTALTHRFADTMALERRLQRAEFDFLAVSRAAQTAFAENYVGLALK